MPREALGGYGGGKYTLVYALGGECVPPETLGGYGARGGKYEIVRAFGPGGACVPLETTFGAGACGGGKRTLVYAFGHCGARAPLGTLGLAVATKGTPGGALALGRPPVVAAHCSSRPRGRSETTKARVKGPQWTSTSSAARQHARGTGHPVKKDASRSCLRRPSVSSDSQHLPESERAAAGKMSKVSDRRGAVESAPCARHAARNAARSKALMVGLATLLGRVGFGLGAWL